MQIKIVEYGSFPHPKGLQQLTPEAAQGLVKHFNSLRGRLARRFGGLPVYVGHPDEPAFAGEPGHTDTRAHGWVQALEARADGLYGTIKWGQTGRELLENAHYKFISPRWVMRTLGEGSFQPVRLLSLGLTNTPNIPGEAIANATATPGAEDADASSFTGPCCEAFPEVAVEAEPDPEVEIILNNAVATAQIAPHEVDAWALRFASNAEQARHELAARGPLLNTQARSAGLGPRRGPLSRSAALLDAARGRMAESGDDYATAWAWLKQHRPELFNSTPE